MANTKAIRTDKEVKQNPDPHIDQDYTGYPNGPASRKHINPKTHTEKKTAGALKKTSKKTYGS